jgi:hypothetical protein
MGPGQTSLPQHPHRPRLIGRIVSALAIESDALDGRESRW